MDQKSAVSELLDRIHALEDEVLDKLEAKAKLHGYEWQEGKAKFAPSAEQRHRDQQKSVWRYLLGARFGAIATVPLIYGCVIPFALLDACLSVYQFLCFPVYGIPRVRREEYFKFDRDRLQYLNALEKVHCFYCSYANGLCGYATEIAARTEQHWCPIKHAERMRAPHSRYEKFFDYGDAKAYAERIEQVRRDFADLQKSNI